MICFGSIVICILIAAGAVGMLFLIEWVEHNDRKDK
jgi:hypothetical protein